MSCRLFAYNLSDSNPLTVVRDYKKDNTGKHTCLESNRFKLKLYSLTVKTLRHN